MLLPAPPPPPPPHEAIIATEGWNSLFLLILEESMLVALTAACHTRPTPRSEVRVMYVVLVDLLLGRLVRCPHVADAS